MTTFKEWLELRGYAASTMRQYLLFERIAPERTQDNVNAFLRAHKGTLPRAFLRLYLHDYLGEKTIEIPRQRGRTKQRLPIYVPKEEYDKFRRAPEIPVRVRLIARLAWASLRASEIIGLTPKSLNLQEHTLRGIGKGNKEFLVIVPDRLFFDLMEYIHKEQILPEARIFRVGYRRASGLICKYTEQVLGKRYSLHKFRHGIATHLNAQGVKLPALQAFMRHSNPATTLIYAHDIPEASREQIAKAREEE